MHLKFVFAKNYIWFEQNFKQNNETGKSCAYAAMIFLSVRIFSGSGHNKSAFPEAFPKPSRVAYEHGNLMLGAFHEDGVVFTHIIGILPVYGDEGFPVLKTCYLNGAFPRQNKGGGMLRQKG